MRPALRTYLILAAPLLFVGFLCRYSRAQDQPKRPRITGIASVRLYVSNIGKSVEFYTQTFGLNASGGSCAHNPVPCFPVNAWQQVELYPAPSPVPKNWLAEVTFATDNLAAMR